MGWPKAHDASLPESRSPGAAGAQQGNQKWHGPMGAVGPVIFLYQGS